MPERNVVAAAGLAVAAAGALYFIFGDVGFNVADEAFLWYGVIHTRAGEVAMRDFQAYQPARYYWSAAWSMLFGPGILGLRASLAIARALGLFFGLLVCRRVTHSPVGLASCAAVLAAWTFPDHKIFEATISLAAVWIGVRLLEAPTARRLFEAGAFTGLAAWIGRNLGLYCGLAFVSILILLRLAGRIEPGRRAILSFALGGVAGAAPLWIMLVVPGFATAFLDSIADDFSQGVNVPLPYPWPWSMSLTGKHGFDALAEIGTTAMFALPLVLYPIGFILALRTPADRLSARAPMIAATFVGMFYLHHAAVRSDIPHLAQAIQPLLILSLAMPACLSARRETQWAAFALLGVATAVVTVNANPSFMQLRPGAQVDLVAHEIAGDVLRLPSVQAAELTNVEAVIRSHVGANEPLFVAPVRPGFYPMFGKRSPDYWIYYLRPATDADQRQTIERLKSAGVEWALITDEAIDGNDALRFRNSNRQVWEYLTRSFAVVDDPRLPPNHTLLQRRAP